jgi:3-oxoacyl-[acyl-carrier-protein] synthase-1
VGLVAQSGSSACFIGVGARTAVGLNFPATAASVRAGLSSFSEHPYMKDREGDPMIIVRDALLPVDLGVSDRLPELASTAAQECLSPLARGAPQLPRVSAFLGLPPQRPGLSEMVIEQIVRQIERAIRVFYPLSSIRAIARGHASGLMALQEGLREIDEGKTDFCLVGGGDSYLEPETLEWLEECEQLHSPENAWGFVPGEGAGFVLLASPEAVRRYGLEVLGHPLAAATAREENLIKTDSVCLGRGLTEALRAAFAHLTPQALKLDQVFCDMNGEPYRADEYAFTVVRTSERFESAGDFLAPADCWGDVGAATGPLLVGLAIAAARKGYAKGPHSLLWASSEGGERSAAIVKIEPVPGGESSCR